MDYIPLKRERKLQFIEKEEKKKVKNTKKTNQTIDELHAEKLKYFNELYTVVLKNKMEEKKNTAAQHALQKLDEEIFDIKNKVEESFYFLKVGKILDEYFNSKDKERKKELTDEYYKILNIPCITTVPDNAYECENCGGQLEEDDEASVCIGCGIRTGANIVFAPTYKEISEGSFVINKKVMYKRESYFLELLKNIQTVKISDFPENLIKDVKHHLYINNIEYSNDITPQLIRSILKKLNYSKYYDQIQKIICIIIKEKPIEIPKPVEEILKHMFEVIQEPWLICKSESRHSFFSYPYVLYKFFQILELDDYLPYLTLLKSREKLIKHELLWEKIMNYIKDNDIDKNYPYPINWRYIPSI